jgi:hypothetical protein
MNADNHQAQVALMSIFRFNIAGSLWGLSQMGIMPRRLRKLKGPEFFKVLGTGGGSGYSSVPGLKKYALLTVWPDKEKALDFFRHSEIMTSYREKKPEIFSLLLHPLKARGEWSGRNPFQTQNPFPGDLPIAVLTRASLKWRFIPAFWKRVAGVSKSQASFEGQYFSQGVGERPWVEQATFSIWKTTEEMERFAHRENEFHMDAIRITRKKNGFREEMYARFQVIACHGSMMGENPLPADLPVF